MSDLQTDVTVTGNRIFGTLHKTTTGALPDYWGPGYFLALNFDDIPDNAVVRVGLNPTQGSGMVALDSDHDAAFKITNKSQQKLVVETTVSGKTQTMVYGLSDLVFAD